MSKIPQGEWSAIAARYAKGESITRIAQSYGCTPPAIHYILKRSRLRAAQNPEQRVNGMPGSATSVPGEPRGSTIPPFSRTALPRSAEHEISGSARDEPGPVTAKPIEARPIREPATAMLVERGQPAPSRRAAGSAPALTAGLDSELHGRAEAAIAAFRASFDAALVEGSPVVRQRLRQAASDLMRVAARTTIVLDRLNAIGEREPSRLPDQGRWSEGR